MDSSFLRTVNLSRHFSSGGVYTLALKEISIDIHYGEFVALMGASGCGKTTLLNILGLIDRPTSGTYFYEGKDTNKLSEKQLLELRSGKIGYIFQNFNLIDDLTVYENIELPLIYLKINYSMRRKMVMEVIERLQLTLRIQSFPWQLSGGQQQQVAIARAMVHQPNLILADEPTGNLDSVNGAKIMEMLSALHAQGTTIVMATHSERDADFASRTLQLFDGKVIHETAQNFVKKRNPK
ncbi:MAG TPA: ABC transporter ATP-binding protein [Salinivirgaceae bacterium]|nr:ABC transporter ATP-binding protein [Salinivirgaceae bacterium]